MGFVESYDYVIRSSPLDAYLEYTLINNRSIYKIVGEKTNSFEYNNFAN